VKSTRLFLNCLQVWCACVSEEERRHPLVTSHNAETVQEVSKLNYRNLSRHVSVPTRACCVSSPCMRNVHVRLQSIELTSTACRAAVHAGHSSLPKAPKHSGHPLATHWPLITAIWPEHSRRTGPRAPSPSCMINHLTYRGEQQPCLQGWSEEQHSCSRHVIQTAS
jgi:hypothetical protein